MNRVAAVVTALGGTSTRVGRILGSRRVVEFRGSLLPARRLRYCGASFQDDAHYLQSAQREANRLIEAFRLGKATPILDMGCGTGRLAIGILSTIGEVTHYRGVDVSALSIRWCQRFITRDHPGFVFVHTNVRNERYNPRGDPIVDSLRLPFGDAEFQIAYAYSVFSHMQADDFRAYLDEFRRVVAPDGRLFLTAFVEENVPEVTVNPDGYRRDWGGSPLHCVRYDRTYLARLLAAAGFSILRFDYETETDGQSGIHASKRTP